MTVIGDAYIDVKSKTDTFDDDVSGKIGGIAKKAAAIFAGAFVFDKGVELFKGFIEQGEEARKTAAQTAAVIESTGGVAGVTAKHVDDLAKAIGRKIGVDDDAIKSSENLLLTFTNLRNGVGKGNDVFDQATGLVQDMSKALGEDARSAAIQLGKALNDPVTGATALRRVGVSLTEQQQDQIKTLVKNNDLLGAQKIVLKELSTEFGGSAAAQATAGDKLRATWQQIQEDLGTKLLPIVDKVAEWLSVLLPKAIDVATGAFRFISDSVKLFVGAFTGAGADVGKEISGGWMNRLIDVGALVRDAFDILRGAFYSFVNAFKAGGDEITSSGFDGKMERFGLIVRSIYNIIVDDILPAIGEFVGFLKENMGPTLAAIGAVIASVAVPAFVSWAVSAAAAAAATIAAAAPVIALGAAVAALAFGIVYAYQHSETFRDVLSTIGRVITEDVWPIVKTVADFMIDHWQPILIAVGAAILGIVSPIALVVAGLVVAYEKFGIVRDIMDTIARVIKDVFVAAVDTAVLVIGNLVETFKFITRVITDVINVVVAIFTGDWAGAWNAFKDIPAAVIDFVRGIFGNFVDWFKSVPGLLLSALGDLTKLLWNVGGDIIRGLGAGIIAVAPAIFDWFTRLPVNIIMALGELTGTLVNKGIDLLMGLLNAAESMAPKIAGWFNQLPFRILSWMGDLGRFLWGKASDIIGSMVSGAENAVGAIAGWFASLPGRIWNWLGELGRGERSLVSKGMDLMSGFGAGIVNVAGALANWFYALPGNIWGWISGIGGWLWDAGRRLIQGLIDGIGSMFDGVKNTLGGLASKIVSWKGPPAKDSRMLFGAGRLIIGGLVDGINASQGDVRAALGGMSSLISGSSLGSLGSIGVGITGARGGGGIVLQNGAIQIAQTFAPGTDRSTIDYARDEMAKLLGEVLDRAAAGAGQKVNR